jgi:large subunit ribosomal protein L4
MEELKCAKNKIKIKSAVGLIHKIYLSQLKTSRVHTASTKTKSEVRGGGRKPWKQKGTGQARAGSIRSPLWTGGGVIFGPKPRVVIKKTNKKENRLAIISALYLKRKSISLISDLTLKQNAIKTRVTLELIKSIKNNTKKAVLFIVPEQNNGFWLSTRNLENTTVVTADNLNLKDILSAEQIILTNKSLELINLNYVI